MLLYYLEPMVRPKELLKSWRSAPPAEDFSSPPWFDRPDALQLLGARRETDCLSDFGVEALRHWADQGCVVLRDGIPSRDLDGMVGDFEGVWDTNEPIESLVIENVKLNPADPAGLPHKKLTTLDR